MKFLGAFFWVLSVLSGHAPDNDRKPDAKHDEQYYAYFSDACCLGDVFLMNSSWIAVIGSQSKNILKDALNSEFGMKMIDCSNSNFHCLGDRINIVVPKKNKSAKSWDFRGQHCKKISNVSGDMFTAVCRETGKDSLYFTFSEVRGVVSYKSNCKGCFNSTYRLRSKLGLFHK
jgi:hypothetical protein